MVYLHLYHGRRTLDEDLEEWGPSGPTFGPFASFAVTYLTTLRLPDGDELRFVGDCVYYDGWLYGDWCIFDDPPDSPADEFDSERAVVPEHFRSQVES